jgi:hypothetical protein
MFPEADLSCILPGPVPEATPFPPGKSQGGPGLGARKEARVFQTLHGGSMLRRGEGGKERAPLIELGRSCGLE